MIKTKQMRELTKIIRTGVIVLILRIENKMIWIILVEKAPPNQWNHMSVANSVVTNFGKLWRFQN